MRRFNLIDQKIFMTPNELIKDNYIFFVSTLINNSLNNDAELENGFAEVRQPFISSKNQRFRKSRCQNKRIIDEFSGNIKILH